MHILLPEVPMIKVKSKFSDFVKGCNCKAVLQLNYHVCITQCTYHDIINVLKLSDPNLLFFAQRHFKVTGSHFSLPCFTMACLTVLVNIADVNADFACHLKNFWILPPWPHVCV